MKIVPNRVIIVLGVCSILGFSKLGNAQSPYKIKWQEESLHLVIGTVTLGAGLHLASRTKGLTPEEIATLDRRIINNFDRTATFNSSLSANKASDILLFSSALIPLSLLAGKSARNDFGNLTILYGETVLMITGITFLTKGLVLRSRPLVYNEEFSLNEKQEKGARHAFFSGHTSLTTASYFFTAKVFSDYFPDSKLKPYLWAGAVVIPALTGYLRVAAGKHYPTDVIAGYAVGAAIGFLIPHLHGKNNTIGAESSLSFALGATGASLTWKLN